jgi:predicted nucleic acid-binding protein
LAVLQRLAENESATVSAQGLAEFFVIATRRLAKPLSPAEAYRQIEAFTNALPVLEITSAVVLEAARAARDYQLSYWDAQVWATAKLNQIPWVLSEDLPGRESLEGVRFLNPFSKDFDLSAL